MKNLLITSCLVMGLSTPLAALATQSDLTISNNTKQYSTCVINNGPCSSVLGAEGVTSPGEQNHKVSAATINFACSFKKDCVADVYMSKNCTGDKVATLSFNVDSGISAAPKILNSKYKINAPLKSFNVSISGG